MAFPPRRVESMSKRSYPGSAGRVGDYPALRIDEVTVPSISNEARLQSEPRRAIHRFLPRYLDHYKSGNFAVRNGGAPTAFREYPFRVLVAFKSAERRNNFAEQLVKNVPPVLTLAWLSTFAEVTNMPLEAVWITPGDYREAAKGTAFDPESREPQSGYQRQTARDVWVETNVPKRSLISEA